jgi:hypothetical protein
VIQFFKYFASNCFSPDIFFNDGISCRTVTDITSILRHSIIFCRYYRIAIHSRNTMCTSQSTFYSVGNSISKGLTILMMFDDISR